MPRHPDVLVVGGGIVGCAVAHRLAKENLSVTLLERGPLGREASWAAGGILSPIHPTDYPESLAVLCAASLKLYPPLVAELGAEVEFRVSGLLLLIADEEGEKTAEKLIRWKRDHGQVAERLDRDHVLARQPGLAPSLRGALFLPDIAQVRNNRLTAALGQAAARLGVEIRTDTPVTGFLRVPGRVNGVKTPRGDVYAGTTVITAGAWSSDLLRPLGLDLPIRPIKGQMLLAQGPPDFCLHMIQRDGTYFVPRADGRILIGSTLEDVGFDKTVTLETVHGLIGRAAAILPGIAQLPLVASWAGLRPATPDRLPYIGRAGMEGLILATGHYRNGILLAPVTAELVAEMIAGRMPSVPLGPFDPLRQ